MTHLLICGNSWENSFTQFNLSTEHQKTLFQLLFNNIFLANCRIVSDMTQSTRRKYCYVRTQLLQSSNKLDRFANSCGVDANISSKYFIISFVRCNWNETKSNPPIDFVQSVQITKRLAFNTLFLESSSFFLIKKDDEKNGRDF